MLLETKSTGFLRVLGGGSVVPSCYGVAWKAWDRDLMICLPIPLNRIAALVHRILLWIRFPSPSAVERLQNQAFADGERSARCDREATFANGVKEGCRQTLDMFGNALGHAMLEAAIDKVIEHQNQNGYQ